MGTDKLNLPDTQQLSNRGDGRLCAPSAARNFAPILEKLRPHVPDGGRVLEIASGTGQQIAALAEEFPDTIWQPSDVSRDRLDSIRAWHTWCKGRMAEPVYLDATDWPDGLTGFDLIYIVNLFHLITEDAAAQILSNCANALSVGGRLFIYGPFIENGRFRSIGDRRFDASLKTQDPSIGYKDVSWMKIFAEPAGLTLRERHDMPANNLSLVFMCET